MSTPFVGELRIFGGNFAPQGWAFCNGQLLAIAQNAVLFNLLGTTYGGDGQTTFALPDLRGRVPVHQGTSPSSGATIVQGQMGGAEQVTLTLGQLPAHGHALQATAADGASADPTNNVWAESDARTFSTAAPNGVMDPSALSPTGGGQAHSNLMPYVAVNFIISLSGLFPSQN
jgi:microcystin-dependent protein